MIAIRADANEHIASGHVMRCLSIADALFSLGEEVIFYTSDEYAIQMITNRGFKAVCLHSDWNDKDSETEAFITELKKSNPRLLLVDSYQVTHDYLEKLRKVVKLAYLDDLNSFDYPVDIVINYSIYAEDLDYPPNKTYLLGTRYVPLRKQFDINDEILDRAIKERDMNKQILIMTGAADPYQLASKIIDSILDEPNLNDYTIAVIKGKFWNEKLSNYRDRVKIYENVENMASLMLRSTMAVSAGGSTLYELCACCVPTVTFSYADNQLGNVNGFADRDIMPYVGDVRTTKDISTLIVRNLLTYHENNDIIINTINILRKLKFRGGAARLAKTFF